MHFEFQEPRNLDIEFPPCHRHNTTQRRDSAPYSTSHRLDLGDNYDSFEKHHESQLRPSPGDVKGGTTHNAYQANAPAACEGASRQEPKQNDHKSVYHSHVICAG